MATVIAVDWSGRRSDDRGTWVATATDGVLTGLEPATRAHAIDCIIDAANRDPMLVAGIDFSFSLPWWVTEFHGRPPMLWQVVAEQGEGWLAACAPPFWGRAGSRRPIGMPLFRRTEQRLREAGWSPTSTFQIGGAGAVGTGSLRGMPFLLRLEREGFGVWPFNARFPRVVEIYPRLLTGRVNKRNPAARAAYVAERRLDLPDAALGCEDAFDAAISALGMSRADQLAALAPATDAVTRAEGEVWVPGATDAPRSVP